jgi:hypothetical protein
MDSFISNLHKGHVSQLNLTLIDLVLDRGLVQILEEKKNLTLIGKS